MTGRVQGAGRQSGRSGPQEAGGHRLQQSSPERGAIQGKLVRARGKMQNVNSISHMNKVVYSVTSD